MIELGLVGMPVSESLSPVLHQTAAQACGLQVKYDLYPTEPHHLQAKFGSLQRAGLRGINVTAPYKTEAAKWVHTLSPTAARLGVVNTVIFEPSGERRGENTDQVGVHWALMDKLPRVPAIAVVLGAGGAARAVMAALSEVAAVRVVARRLEAAQRIADELGGGRATGWPLLRLPEALCGAHLLITCLPASALKVVLNAPLHQMAPQAHLMDLGYGPSAQRIVQRGLRAGLSAQDGLAMLAAQGVASFEHWTARHPPVHQVLHRLRDAQRQREDSGG